MAQPSKKLQVASAALPLFLANGFKATSVDMVVKSAKVSKPTVYNHFPDKSALMVCVTELWLSQQHWVTKKAPSLKALWASIEYDFFTDTNVRYVAMAIGEGGKFPAARRLVFEAINDHLRTPLAELGSKKDVQLFNHQLIEKLMTLEPDE